MTDKKAAIQALQEQTARQRKLKSVRQSLEVQKAELQKRVDELDNIRKAEQADVDRLEGGSLAAFFYALVGQKEEKLAQEQQEAYTAAVKYDAANRDLESVIYDLKRVNAELDTLNGCEDKLQTAIESRLGELKSSGTPEAALILELEGRANQNIAAQKEIREAIGAGQRTLYTVESVLNSLDSAEGWGVWDLIGGGLLSDIAKHEHLDNAQAEIEQLQIDLRRFHSELADTEIYADLNVKVDGFLLFADYFFDGLFADWAVLDHIQSSKEQVNDIYEQINNTLTRLECILNEKEAESLDIKQQLDKLAISL